MTQSLRVIGSCKFHAKNHAKSSMEKGNESPAGAGGKMHRQATGWCRGDNYHSDLEGSFI